MTGGLLGAAALFYLAGAWTYFRVRWRLAGAAAAGFYAATAWLSWEALGPLGGVLLYLPLGALPGTFLVLHAVDARVGFFMLPSFYAIPLAFLSGVLLWAALGVAVLAGALGGA